MSIKVTKGKCSGCRLCRQVCAIYHFNEENPRKAAIGVQAQFPVPGIFTPKVCTQCGLCAKACPEEAIVERDGVWYILEDRCTMCLECVEACPFGVVFVHPEVNIPIKCDWCYECLEVCNTGAITLGKKLSKQAAEGEPETVNS